MIFAPVKEVKVYQNSAVIRRSGTVSLHAGRNEVILTGVGRYADPDSIRLFFPAGIICADVHLLPYAQAVEKLPSQAIADKIDEAESRIRTLQSMEDLWIANGNFTERSDYSAEMIEKYIDALPQKLEKLRTQKKELYGACEELKKQLELQQNKEAVQAVRLILEAAANCEAAFEMEYADNSARWYSTFEIHAAEDADTLSVLRRARIFQDTGEDWQDVGITLYTGNPTARQEIPEIRKHILQYRQDMTTAPMPTPMLLRERTIDPSMPGMAKAPVPQMAMNTAAEEDAQTMTSYLLHGARTVISGAAGAMADLKTDTVPANIRIVCVPPLDDSAYLAAFIKTADWPLEPSSAKIYLDGNYCGEIYVAPDMTKEEFTLSLGRNEHVSVSRKEIRAKTEDVLLKGQKRKTCEYEIRIANNRAKPCDVTVWDQIPVSAEKQIVVNCTEKDGAVLDGITGKLTWGLNIPGGSTAVKRLAYTITCPKDKLLKEVQTSSASAWIPPMEGIQQTRFCPACGAQVSGTFCVHCGRAIQ